MYLDVASTTKLKYYLLSSKFAVAITSKIVFERFVYIATSSEPSSNDVVCSDKSTYTDQERLNVAIAKNNPAGATIPFPCEFQASYSYHSTLASCSSSYVDICESSVTFIYSLCPEAQMFSIVCYNHKCTRNSDFPKCESNSTSKCIRTNQHIQVVPCCNEKDDIPDDNDHDNEQNKDNDSKMDIIIGLLIGCGVVLVLKIAVFIWIMRTRKTNK
ncbi:hypothetical protein KUTeg_024182 [Tegillarca granosa]|uniref:Uncharacterized protein n=1 Tax=Tegillarca granosa TaxID=220873 RepID=A0ABQ9DWL9_TEGGR|nr:hypothetical protein KUTeg_024182 [Tegillarca granosa]